jgi:hypothetical protein
MNEKRTEDIGNNKKDTNTIRKEGLSALVGGLLWAFTPLVILTLSRFDLLDEAIRLLLSEGLLDMFSGLHEMLSHSGWGRLVLFSVGVVFLFFLFGWIPIIFLSTLQIITGRRFLWKIKR